MNKSIFEIRYSQVDNREISGPNAEDYFTLLRRRNSARDGMDAAISKYGSKQ